MTAVETESGRPLTPEQSRMVEENLGLVGFMIRKFGTCGSDYEDAWADGVFGLMRAVQLFDPERGFRFSTYAQQWIRQAIQQGHARLAGRNWRHAVNYGSYRGRERGEYVAPVSLDAPLSAADDIPLVDAIPVEGGQREVDDTVRARQLLDDLRRHARDEFDLAILNGIAMGDSLSEIARRHGRSLQNLQQRRARIFGRYRHPTGRHPIVATA